MIAQFQGYYFLRGDGDAEIVCVVFTPDADENISVIDAIEAQLTKNHGANGWVVHHEDKIGYFPEILEKEGFEKENGFGEVIWNSHRPPHAFDPEVARYG